MPGHEWLIRTAPQVLGGSDYLWMRVADRKHRRAEDNLEGLAYGRGGVSSEEAAENHLSVSNYSSAATGTRYDFE